MAEKFFTIPAGTHPTVKALAENMQKQNVKLKFTDALIKSAGYPRWDKAKLGTTANTFRTEGEEESEDTTVVYVPFELANTTSAVMTIAINLFSTKDTAYNMLYPQHYKVYGFDTTLPRQSWNARILFKMFFQFDEEIYGTDSMWVFDGRIFGKDEEDTLKVKKAGGLGGSGRSSNGNGITTEYWATECTNFHVCIEKPKRAFRSSNITESNPDCGFIEVCNSSWVENGPGGGGWNEGDPNPFAFPPGDGSGGAPGGLEDLSNIPPCPPEPRTRMSTEIAYLNPCNPPWVPALPAEQYNPFMYDTIGISNALESIFPCVYAFINDSLPNANFLAQLAGSSIFKDSVYMHLTFDTSTTHTQAGEASGETLSSNVSILNGRTNFSATIKLNGWYLRNGAKEFMVATIVHEVMHAVLKLRWGQYQTWLSTGQGGIDSAFMKTYYPIYWENYVINGIPPDKVSDHEIMMTDYFNTFKAMVGLFWNPSAPQAKKDSVLKSLCYAGMRETTAWKLLGIQGNDTCKYRNENYAASRSKTSSFSLPGCGTYTTHYLDSLKLRAPCN